MPGSGIRVMLDTEWTGQCPLSSDFLESLRTGVSSLPGTLHYWSPQVQGFSLWRFLITGPVATFVPADLLRAVSVWVSLGGECIPSSSSECNFSYCCLYFVFVAVALLLFSSLTNLNLFLSLSGYRIFNHLNQFAFLYCFSVLYML